MSTAGVTGFEVATTTATEGDVGLIAAEVVRPLTVVIRIAGVVKVFVNALNLMLVATAIVEAFVVTLAGLMLATLTTLTAVA